MKVTAFIRQKVVAKNNTTDKSTIFFRVRDVNLDIKVASELTINANHWSDERQGYKLRVNVIPDNVKNDLNKKVREITDLINEKYHKGVDGKWLRHLIQLYHHPNMIYDEDGIDTRLTAQVEEYYKRRDVAQSTIYKAHTIIKKIKHFEQYMQNVKHRKGYTMYVEAITEEDLYLFKEYILDEYLVYLDYPEIFSDLQPWQLPKAELSENGAYDILHRLRTVMKWVEFNGITTTKPFYRFELKAPIYGTPWYLTLEERDRIWNLDLSAESNQLNFHRDIFIFQCCVGCRMGDIGRFTKDNIVNGALEYVPHKTAKSSGRLVRVPLNQKAQTILNRYSWRKTTLLPYFEDWEYNDGIKTLCTMAGITRIVSVLDPKTRKEVKRPLNEIASSHMARRTFIGNMYKKVKDPDLIGSMSGHVEGSKAFARYRTIDDEMKRELVDMIN